MKHCGRQLLALLLSLTLVLNLGVLTVFADEGTNLLQDGSFEGNLWTDGIWSMNPDTTWENTTIESSNKESAHGQAYYLNYWSQSAQIITVSQSVKLEAGTYTLTAYDQGSGSTIQLFIGEQTGAPTILTGWGTWDLAKSTFSIEESDTYTVGAYLNCEDGGWGYLDDMSLVKEADASDDNDDNNPENYAITVASSDAENILAGDIVTLTATITKNGQEITNLAGEGLSLWWWTDIWAEGHTDGLADTTYNNYDDNSGNSLTADVTLPSAGTYYIAAELKNSSDRLAIVYIPFTVSEAPAELVDIPLENGNFENGTTNWTLEGFSSVNSDEWNTNNPTNTLNLWLSNSEACSGSASYTVKLTKGTYRFGFDLSGMEGDSGLLYSIKSNNEALLSGTETYATTGYGNWNTCTTGEFTLSEDTEVTFTLSGTVPAGYWGNLDNLTLKGTGSLATSEEEDPIEADINVTKVKDLPSDFIMGMDISSVISEFDSGVTYKDFEGNTIDNINDFCRFLAECGVTHVRVRIWNDPVDSNGNSYGGGHNDLATAVEIAQGCAEAGLKLLVDFHCSDFWTDPGKQQTPKAWAGYTVDEKASALKTFLTDSLTKIANTGAKIAMVQVGNETTSGFIGETSTENMCTLFNAGAAAVRSFDSSIKVVIHITNPEKNTMTTWAKNLLGNNVDYDILATSYYPSWHGTFANLKSQLQTVRDTYGKDVMVAETSYAYTLNETDGHENTIRSGNNDSMMCETQYPFSVQGQASYLRDLIAAVNEAGGLGVYYWESAWITVGDTTDLTGDVYDTQVEANKQLWEKNGSGWASSYAKEYDPDDAGKWYGGSAVDNQAMFAPDGSPLASINVWTLVRSGAISKHISVDEIAALEESIETGNSYTLPDTIAVTYSSGVENESVKWDDDDIKAIDINTPGTYIVNGTVTFSKEIDTGDYADQTTAPVTFTLTVKAINLIGDDWSFENGSSSFKGLDTTGKGIDGETPYDDTHCLHWYLTSEGTASVIYAGEDQKGISLEPGKYTFECLAQGYAGDTVSLNILTHGSDSAFANGEPTSLTGWAVWHTPTVSFTLTEATTVDLQMQIGIQAGGWGTIDCMYLYKTSELHTHTFRQEVTAPTCTEQGYTTYICTADDCDYSYVDNYVDAIGHSYTNYVSGNDATCTQDGTKTALCDHGCGTASTIADASSAKGHSFGDWKSISSPDCINNGSEQRKCSVCGYTESRELDPNGHEWDDDFTIDKAPTCTTDGSKSIHCKNCDVIKESTVIPATGHTYGDPVFVWNTDFNCVATFTCTELDDMQSIDCIVSRQIIPATAAEAAKALHTATVTFNGVEYTDSKTFAVNTPTEKSGDNTQKPNNNTQKPTDSTNSSVPKTGDSAPYFVLSVIFIIAVVSCIVLTTVQIRRHHRD